MLYLYIEDLHFTARRHDRLYVSMQAVKFQALKVAEACRSSCIAGPEEAGGRTHHCQAAGLNDNIWLLAHS